MITQKLGKKFLFHSNLDLNPKQINHYALLSGNLQKMEQKPISVAQYPIYNNFPSHLVQ